MRIYLIIPNVQGQYFKPGQPHAGVAWLAGTLLNAGHKVSVSDMRVEPDIKFLFQRIRKFKPAIIGINCVSLGYLGTYKFVEGLKKKFKLPIILGGPHIATLKEKVLSESAADFAVLGEGEKTILELLEQFQGKKDYAIISGLIWKKGKEVVINPPRLFIENLDDLPFPAFQLFPLEKYIDKKIPIVSSRGCPGNCIYCLVKVLLGQRFRPRSPESVLAEMEYWHMKGYNFFEFNDDCFSANINRAEAICNLIIKRKLNIKWEVRNGIRADRLTLKLARKMKKAGCGFVAFGVESADPEVLKLMKKGVLIKQVKKAFKIMKQAGIGFTAFFMIGTPGDTFKKFLKTYQFAKDSNPDEVRFYNTIPYPGTELFDWINDHGKFLMPYEKYLNDIERWEGKPVFETDDFPAKERIKAFNLAEQLVMIKFFQKYFGVFYFLPFFIWKNKILRSAALVPGQKIWLQLRKFRK